MKSKFSVGEKVIHMFQSHVMGEDVITGIRFLDHDNEPRLKEYGTNPSYYYTLSEDPGMMIGESNLKKIQKPSNLSWEALKESISDNIEA